MFLSHRNTDTPLSVSHSERAGTEEYEHSVQQKRSICGVGIHKEQLEAVKIVKYTSVSPHQETE